MEKTRWYKFDQNDYAPDLENYDALIESDENQPQFPKTALFGKFRQLFRRVLLLLIAVLPGNALRILLYRILLGYDIDYQSRVGMLNYLHLGSCRLRGARIGSLNLVRANRLIMAEGACIYRFNRIQDVSTFSLGQSSLVRSRNNFIATAPDSTPFKHLENFTAGDRCLITNEHFFDLSDEIRLGDNVTFGGQGTQVWTHGVSVDRVRMQSPVTLGNHIYIGSRSLIVQGVQIGARVVIGAGTVVSRSLAADGFYVSSKVQCKGQFQEYVSHPDLISYRGNAFLRKKPE
ncbi:acyltransferase [Thermithiobacillus plumbiphilus]|uniref:DapH/DapD/GlmU-related protein n=1 Tax=Thermithiobacillus plumbiphilus TaxID=1729899 RepID=A0ABU9DDP5_9PROT